jgi:sRNA-binding carbon storage regulator CsrA
MTTPTKRKAGWLVLSRKPGESIVAGDTTLTYEGRINGGDAVLTVRRNGGAASLIRLAAGESLVLYGMQIVWQGRGERHGGNTIRLQIRAPRDTRILRSELVAHETAQAARAAA